MKIGTFLHTHPLHRSSPLYLLEFEHKNLPSLLAQPLPLLVSSKDLSGTQS
jgi:hypothetical protein